MPAPRIKLRPHHFMCVHGFQGHGYSPEFVRNFWDVLAQLDDGEQALVQAVEGTEDNICQPCPNNRSDVCVEEKKVRKLDDAYAATLELKAGDRLTWAEAKKLVARKVTDEDFERNCDPCGWKKLGVCKSALQKLRTTAMGIVVMWVLTAAALPPRLAHAQTVATPMPTPVPSRPAPKAATDAPAAAASSGGEGEDSKVATVDQLEQRVLNDKKLRVPSLYKVQSALNAYDYRKAIDAAKSLESNTEFADYYHYLLGQAEMGRMKKAFSAGTLATAQIAGEQARLHFSLVQSSNAYTTLAKRSAAYQGEVEIALGNIYLKKKNRQKAVDDFESGFQRLSQVNLLALVPKATVVSYAILCDKRPTALCPSWVMKLAPFIVKTEEARIVDRFSAFKRPYIERSSPSVPYKVDLDLQSFQKGFASYLDGKYDDAFGTWRDLLHDYPRTNIKLRTKFWMARAAQRSHHDTQAETLFREVIKELPFSYYALLSSWYGNIDLGRMMDIELPQATSETSMLTPADIIHIRRAEMLIASAVPELANFELQDVHPTLNMPNEFLVYMVALNNLAGNHQAAFQMLSELSTRSFQGLFSRYGQKLYFPTTRLPLIRSTAKEWNVDPLLVISVVKQESAFNAEAVSGANAYGLMQLIPPTARELDAHIEVLDLLNPMQNVRLGTKYIHQLLARYKGNVISALAAYNAGPGNSDRWQREARLGLPPEEFIEQIGFKETREYVQSILRNYYWYNRRIKGDSFPNLTALTQFISPIRGAAIESRRARKSRRLASAHRRAR